MLNDLGVIIDISHLSDGGARDVLKLSCMPVMATHSNARAITKVSRNLPDELIRSLADGGGAIGVNFFANFLGVGDGNLASSVDNMLRHIKHIVNVGGIDCMAIGTDFDGIPYEGIQIEDISQIHKLDDGLVKAGFSAANRDKIFYKNALRVFLDVLK